MSLKKRSLASVPYVVLATLVLASWPATTSSAVAASARAGSSTFAESIAGLWVSNAATSPPWTSVGFRTLLHLHADGTMLWSHNREYGGTGFGPDGAVYGIWKQTGPLEVTTRELGFLYKVGGEQRATGRVTRVITFSPDFQSYSDAGVEELFHPHQNPNDPAEAPFASFNISGLGGTRTTFP